MYLVYQQMQEGYFYCWVGTLFGMLESSILISKNWIEIKFDFQNWNNIYSKLGIRFHFQK
jgi:hypothetical protein